MPRQLASGLSLAPSGKFQLSLLLFSVYYFYPYFPGGSDGIGSVYNVGDLGSIPGSGRSPGEVEMAIHSSTIAWKIPWTEEPGRLQSMGSQRVRHD